jgi:hypothetical protein
MSSKETAMFVPTHETAHLFAHADTNTVQFVVIGSFQGSVRRSTLEGRRSHGLFGRPPTTID